jgi:parallel beta-helix repeat protein
LRISLSSRLAVYIMIAGLTAGALPGAACISSGTDASINAALVGTGAVAELCPGAVFSLANPVTFTAPNQQLYTQGLPTDGTRALLRVTGSNLSMAIYGNNQPGVVVKNIQVDGNRPNLGKLTNGALIEMGGAGSNQTVSHIVAYEPRDWSVLHFFEGTVTGSTPQCQGAVISDNQIGPAGTPDGNWADGISLACGNSLVQNNTIQDATDGAIVIFGAPGSTIQNNTIIASTRQLLGGINMVDYAPVNGNYTGTLVTGNVIDGQGDFIKVGIAMGPQIWGCGSGTNYGATVTNNTLQGQNIGYGYAVNGVTSWTVTGNTDNSRHVGAVAAGCGGTPSAPAGYQYQVATASTLQSEFHSATLRYVLGVSEPSILRVAQTPTGCTDMLGNQGLYPGQSLYSCDGRFHLILQNDGNLVLYQGGTPLWASGTTGSSSAVAIMQGDGNFVIYNAAGTALWSSGTPNHSGAYLAVQNDGNVVIYSSVGIPLWSTNTCCH